MKILYIDPMSYNNLAIYDYNLLSNIECEIYFAGNELYDIELPTGVTFCPIFKYSQKKSLFKIFSYIISILKIVKLVKKINPDIIHIQWIRLWFVDFLFLKYLRWKRKNIIYTAHNILPHNERKSDYQHYYKYYHSLKNIIVHSKKSKEQLVSEFNIKQEYITVIPHGVLDLSQALDKQSVAAIKKELSEKYDLSNKIVFSMLGGLDKYKGSDLVFDVWNESFATNEEVFLFTCGKISDEISTNIDLLQNTYTDFNRIDNAMFLAILQLTDVLLLPYRKISQSGVLLSAINEKIPFLVSNAGGLSDALSIANVGWNIGIATKKTLSEQMQSILNNKDELNEKKHSPLWEKLSDYYSWKEIGIKIQRLYEKSC